MAVRAVRQRLQPLRPATLAVGVVSRVVQLSPRQADVLRELLTGAENAEIGKRLYLTEDTVKTHLRRIYGITGIRRRLVLALAVDRGDIVPVVEGRDWWDKA